MPRTNSAPLGTIAIVAKELERYASLTPGTVPVADDSRLIRTEVERCRTILEHMSIEGAEPAGEACVPVPVKTLVQAVRASFPPETSLRVEEPEHAMELVIPQHAVEQALIALVKNAIEASPSGIPVRLRAAPSGSGVRFEIADQGCGIDPDAIRHVGEPFFTTKEPGHGMGLGVFLVRTLADRLRGRFAIDSEPGRGIDR